jgi:predicted TPR repeat methyltransferase
MSYRFLAPIYDWVAPNFSRYRSSELLTSKLLDLAPAHCELLYVGVGTGLSVTPYFKSPRFKRIVGVDPSARMLDRCRHKFPDMQLHQGTLEQVQQDLVSPFDVIQSCGAVEHVSDFNAYAGQVAVLLKLAGYFAFTFEPEVLFSSRQSPGVSHIGTWGMEKVFRRRLPDVYAALAKHGFAVYEDIEFKA